MLEYLQFREFLRKEEIALFLCEIRYVLLFYVLGDWLTTLYALDYGFEGNILPAFVIAEFGVFYILVLKLAFISLLFAAYQVIRHYPWLWGFTRGTISGVGFAVSVWNLTVILFGPDILRLVESSGL